ncbi:MAG: PH domain-containing protein, partial [Balneolaceae bacterium]
MSEKKIVLKPSRKSLFWWYVLGVLLIPLLGFGFYLIYRTHKTYSLVRYTITDHKIQAVGTVYTENVDIVNIRDVEIRTRWIDKYFGIGDLILKTDEKSMELLGMENPERLSEMILHAADAERKRLETSRKKKPEPEPAAPGTLDKLDYLTGLWQQGLLSDEDFKKEKKYFE